MAAPNAWNLGCEVHCMGVNLVCRYSFFFFFGGGGWGREGGGGVAQPLQGRMNGNRGVCRAILTCHESWQKWAVIP